MRTIHRQLKFDAARARLAPEGSAEGEAVAFVLRQLADERLTLPGVADHLVKLPFHAMGRTVPSTSLVVAYAPIGDDVYVFDLRRA